MSNVIRISSIIFVVNTTDDSLRKNLAAAIASCATFGNNTQELGRLRTVTPIVSYMTSDDPEVHRTTAMALEKLSTDPQNCITMHQVLKNLFIFLYLPIVYYVHLNFLEWCCSLPVRMCWFH